MTDSEVGNERFGSEGTRGSRLLKVFRLRQKALKRLGLLLVQGGVDPNDWNMQRVRPARRCPKEGVNEPACSCPG
jgi:hypothetical protein